MNCNLQWEEVTLQELINRNWITYHLDGNHGGEYPRSEEFVKYGVPYISANCIVDGAIDFSNAKYVTIERSKRFRKGIAQKEMFCLRTMLQLDPLQSLKLLSQ